MSLGGLYAPAQKQRQGVRWRKEQAHVARALLTHSNLLLGHSRQLSSTLPTAERCSFRELGRRFCRLTSSSLVGFHLTPTISPSLFLRLAAHPVDHLCHRHNETKVSGCDELWITHAVAPVGPSQVVAAWLLLVRWGLVTVWVPVRSS